MMTLENMTAAGHPDAQLVSASRAGDRNAFGLIVTRYQSLVCSVAYSATGSLSLSEDVAQETFIAAWKQLGELREPEKLRAWLCGIARNLTRNALRRLGREPVESAETLEAAHELPAPEQPPADHAISREEETILWRSLERIPETYREPLVLFYREGQSVEQTAALLELSEDAVKQRLSRGRKLLAEEVAAFVEGALKNSTPGKAFTLTVLASLPVLTASAKAATLGAVAAKGSTAAKAAMSVGLLNAVLGPVLGLFGTWIGYRLNLDSAKSESEREFIRRFYRRLCAGIVVFGLALGAVLLLSYESSRTHPRLFSGLLIGVVAAYLVYIAQFSLWARRETLRLRAARGAMEAAGPAKPAWEYRSQTVLLGLPLVHLRLDTNARSQTPVKAWIAAGGRAYGLLLAFGGLAIAPISVGGVAIGLMPWGGFALGLFAIGGFALGGWTFGGLTIAWQAFGGVAFAWNAAMGGVAIAHDYALGGFAQATQANNEIASHFIKSSPFFKGMEVLARYAVWMNLLWLLPLLIWWRKLVKRTK